MTWNGRDIHQPTQDLVIETDASLVGWGAVCPGVQTGGLWSQEEQLEHINVLELTVQDGGNLVHQINCSGMSDLGLVSSKADNPISVTFTRLVQSGGRPRVQASTDLSRMEASQGDLYGNLCSTGTM